MTLIVDLGGGGHIHSRILPACIIWVWFIGLQQKPRVAVIMMMMKCQFEWWGKLEHPEETPDLRQVTDNTFTHNALCQGPNPDSSGLYYDVRHVPNPGSSGLYYDVRHVPNPGSSGLYYDVRHVPNPGSSGLYYDVRHVPNRGSSGLYYDVRHVPNPGSSGLYYDVRHVVLWNTA